MDLKNLPVSKRGISPAASNAGKHGLFYSVRRMFRRVRRGGDEGESLDNASAEPTPYGAKRPDASRFGARTFYFIIFFLVAAMGFGIIVWANYEFSQEDQMQSENVQSVSRPVSKVRVQLEFSNTKRAFEGTASPDLSVEGALKQVAAVADLNLRIKNGAILAVGDKQSSQTGSAWKLYINGENISDGLSQLVHGGDRIVLRYE